MATCKDCLHYEVCEALEQGNGIMKVSPIHCGCFKPDANFAEVKRGEWIAKAHVSRSKRGRTIRYSTYKCPICRKWNGKHKPNYCPNCGADMRPLDKD